MKTVAFAYNNLGCVGFKALLENGFDVKALVTHPDDPREKIYFDSVAALAAEAGIEVITTEDPNNEAVIAKLRALKPDAIFSFYYRKMLCDEILALAPGRDPSTYTPDSPADPTSYSAAAARSTALAAARRVRERRLLAPDGQEGRRRRRRRHGEGRHRPRRRRQEPHPENVRGRRQAARPRPAADQGRPRGAPRARPFPGHRLRRPPPRGRPHRLGRRPRRHPQPGPGGHRPVPRSLQLLRPGEAHRLALRGASGAGRRQASGHRGQRQPAGHRLRGRRRQGAHRQGQGQELRPPARRPPAEMGP